MIAQTTTLEYYAAIKQTEKKKKIAEEHDRLAALQFPFL